MEQEMIRYDHMRHISIYVSSVNFMNGHAHGSFELSYVLDGSALFHRGAETANIRKGDLVLTNPYEPHSFASIGEKPLVMLTLQIHKLFARRYIEIIPWLRFDGDRVSCLPKDQHDTLVKLLFRAASSYFSHKESWQFDVIGYVTLLLGELTNVLHWKIEKNADSLDKELQNNRAQRLADYIDENYRQKITLSMLADMEGITPTYLSHFFRKVFGVSFQSYLSMQRFEKALVLMRDNKNSILDICMNCGFSDSRYLEAACIKTFGCTVSEYRKRRELWEECEIQQGSELLYKKYGRKESAQIIMDHIATESLGTLC